VKKKLTWRWNTLGWQRGLEDLTHVLVLHAKTRVDVVLISARFFIFLTKLSTVE
jgi:hypothetical protein